MTDESSLVGPTDTPASPDPDAKLMPADGGRVLITDSANGWIKADRELAIPLWGDREVVR
jgi:hypothetical protein